MSRLSVSGREGGENGGGGGIPLPDIGLGVALVLTELIFEFELGGCSDTPADRLANYWLPETACAGRSEQSGDALLCYQRIEESMF